MAVGREHAAASQRAPERHARDDGPATRVAGGSGTSWSTAASARCSLATSRSSTVSRLTTPLRTALDLGRQRWPEPAITALDALHRLGTFSRAELLDEVDRFKGMRWVTTLRLVAPHTDGRSQSGGESVIRWRWLQLPVPPPEPQVEVRSGSRVAFIDVGSAGIRAGVEYDGVEWHDRRGGSRARRRTTHVARPRRGLGHRTVGRGRRLRRPATGRGRHLRRSSPRRCGVRAVARREHKRQLERTRQLA